jgi:hypothetical protein
VLELQGRVEVVYTLRSAAPGTFELGEFSWVAYDALHTNAAFGHSESGDNVRLTVVDVPGSPVLTYSNSIQGFTLSVAGVSGATYSVEVSTNLMQWVQMATVSAPFVFTDTKTAGFNEKFYRAVWVPQ